MVTAPSPNPLPSEGEGKGEGDYQDFMRERVSIMMIDGELTYHEAVAQAKICWQKIQKKNNSQTS